MLQGWKPFLMLLLITSTSILGVAAEEEDEKGCGIMDALPYIVVGAGAAVVAAPYAMIALGFTGTGIAAHSLAAWLMKVSAIANGGGVPAGGLVATLQSWGAAGFSYFFGGAGAVAGYTYHQTSVCGKKVKPECEAVFSASESKDALENN